MSAPAFSILHATYGRPEKAVAAMRMWFDRAANPSAIEYIFAVNSDDESRHELLERARAFAMSTNTDQIITRGDFAGSAPAWDAAARISTGQLLIQGQDDVEPPHGWDFQLHKRMMAQPEWYGSPAFIAVSDGYRTDGICCTAIMNRARYEQQGEFLHAGYISVFSDDEVTYRARRDARDGKCTLIDARDLTFLHRHHYHDKSVPMDATYERENSAEAYRIGGALFVARNPWARTDGLRTWM